MEIVEKKVEDLIPYERNPRRNDDAVKYVKASINEFGFKVPIVIDVNNVIVAGHTRLMAAKELGIKKVPCIIASDLTEEQIKAFRLADNKVAEFAGWDFELLDAEVDDIIDIDMSEFGFIDFDDEFLPDPYDKDLEAQYESVAEASLAKKRIIITYDAEQETMLCEWLKVPTDQPLKVVWSFNELISK